jgi:hypothetical protein
MRSVVQPAKTDLGHGSIPTSRRRSPFRCRTSRLPWRSFRLVSASASASRIRRPARRSTTISPHPPAVTTVASLAHDDDDLVDRRRIGPIPSAFVRWDPAGVMAGYRRRRARTTGGIQELMSRHGSLLWRADWFAACSSRGGRRTPVRRSWPLAGSPAAAYPAGCGSEAISAPHRPWQH